MRLNKTYSSDFHDVVLPTFVTAAIGMGLLQAVRTLWLVMDPLLLWAWVPMYTPFSLTLASIVKIVVVLLSTLTIIVAIHESRTAGVFRSPLAGLLFIFSGLMWAYVFLADAIGSSVIASYQQTYGMNGERANMAGHYAPYIRRALEIINAQKSN